jgi:hypothetical protein
MSRLLARKQIHSSGKATKMPHAQEDNAGALNVKLSPDERPISGAQWLVLSICILVLVVDGLHTAAPAFLVPALPVSSPLRAWLACRSCHAATT